MQKSRSDCTDITVIHTVGHSKHPIAHFVSLLKEAGIETLVDVRSHPGSRFNPQFNRDALVRALNAADIEYRYLGDALGGKPKDPALLDAVGKPDYARMARTQSFLSNIEQLVHAANESSIAIMCAEEDPARCHRTLLISPSLVERGMEVRHIRGDGHVVPHDGRAGPRQPDLFR